MKSLFVFLFLFSSLHAISGEITWSKFINSFKNNPKAQKEPSKQNKQNLQKSKPLQNHSKSNKNQSDLAKKDQQVLEKILKKNMSFYFTFGYTYGRMRYSVNTPMQENFSTNSIGFRATSGLEHYFKKHSKFGYRLFSTYTYSHSLSVAHPQLILAQSYGGGLDFFATLIKKKTYHLRSYAGFALKDELLIVSDVTKMAIITKSKKSFFQAPFRCGFVVDFIGYLSLQWGFEIPLVKNTAFNYDGYKEHFSQFWKTNFSIIVSF
ncbi:outer membrane beta-barrel protein [Helicobacter cetorum]|uniref:outer membrane beta-barrel protein n=1 Tax=Helicobacter cetorum TaxID=138563 RepID=UPI000CF133D4|nr:outer membrane beta-barrel protein [Helicobacter cetorum]